MDPTPTPFVESNFLLAVVRGDDAEARRIAEMQMTPTERLTLFVHLGIARMILEEIDE